MHRTFPIAFICLSIAACGYEEQPTAISKGEILEGMNKWVGERDQNGDLKLSKSEWDAIYKREFPDWSDMERGRWGDRDFANYDTNGNGFVEASELSALSLEGLNCLDSNGDGRLSSSEKAPRSSGDCRTSMIENR